MRNGVKGFRKNDIKKELHNLYSSPNIFNIIKSRIMRWAGHRSRMGKDKYMHIFYLKILKGRDSTHITQA